MKIKTESALRANELILVAGVFLCFSLFFQFSITELFEPDGYYHITFAHLLRTRGFLRQFPWAQFSLWKDHFSDKEFLFHVYLIPFTFFNDLLAGMKIAMAILTTLAVVSFYSVLTLNGGRQAWFWTTALFAFSAIFFHRISLPRAHVLSVTLALWAFHFILNQKDKALFVLCVIYTWSYVGFHLPIIFSVIAAFYYLTFEGKFIWKTTAYATLGTVLGCLIHPYFPYNFYMFYTQAFHTFAMSIESGVAMAMGQEFKALSTKKALIENAGLLFFYCIVIFTALVKPLTVSTKTKISALLSFAFLFLAFLSQRYFEYAVPFSMLFFGLFFSPYFEDFSLQFNTEGQKLRSYFAVLACFLLVLSLSFYSSAILTKVKKIRIRYSEAANYLKEHTQENETVFVCDWSSTPELFFFNQKNRYLFFLDPDFIYSWNQKAWQNWWDVTMGQAKEKTYDTLKDYFGVRYGVCDKTLPLFGIVKENPKMETVYQDDRVFVFKLR